VGTLQKYGTLFEQYFYFHLLLFYWTCKIFILDITSIYKQFQKI
jgi:hypothetical protein